MEDPEFVKKDLNDDESLADAPLTPVEKPRGKFPGRFVKGMALVGAAGAGLIVLFAPAMQSCRGATRSWKLKWQERQAEIEQADRDAKSDADHQP